MRYYELREKSAFPDIAWWEKLCSMRNVTNCVPLCIPDTLWDITNESPRKKATSIWIQNMCGRKQRNGKLLPPIVTEIFILKGFIRRDYNIAIPIILHL